MNMAEYQKFEYRIGKGGKVIETMLNASQDLNKMR